MKKLEEALVSQKKQTEPYNQPISGMLGVTLGGGRVVEVPNRNSYVYVRLRNNQNELIQAFNNKVAPVYNLPVVVKWQINRYVVLDVETKRYDNNWGSYSPYLARHGNTHSFDLEAGGGGDVVWVHGKQFMPLLGLPSGSVGSPHVVIAPYLLRNENGTWRYVGNTGTSSVTPYNPSTSGTAIMMLIVLNTTTGNPYFLVGSGSSFASNLTGTSQIIPYLPSLTNPADIPIAAVRLVSGTSRLTWDNLYDTRQYVHPINTGSGGGLSSVATQDEGVPKGNVTTFNFVGSVVDVSVSGSVARVFVTGSTGGTSFTGEPSAVVLTNPSGTLFGSQWLKWGQDAREFLEFGANVAGKETNAGKMGYGSFGDNGIFYIIGAGTGTRTVGIYDNLIVSNESSANAFNINDPANTYNITGSPHQHANYISPSYIDGLEIKYRTSGSITVGLGSAYLDSLGRLLTVSNVITGSISPVSTTVSGSWQNVYLYDGGGGTAAIEIDTTAPSSPYAGSARTKSGDTSRRYLGSLYCDTGGYLYRFNSIAQGNVMKANWLESVNAFPFQFANVSGTVTTPTAINIPWLVPTPVGLVHELVVQTVHNLVAAGDNVMSITDNTGITIPAASNINAESLTRMTNGSASSTNIQIAASPIKISGSQLLYTHSNVAGTNGGFFRARGYHIPR